MLLKEGMKRVSLLLKTIFVAVLTHSIAEAREVPFSVNDMAVLMPLDATSGAPKFKVLVADPTWNVLSKENFSKIIASAERTGIFVNDKIRNPNNWYLVGVRYSPCTIFAGSSPRCVEQMRFVFQPFKALRSAGFDDYALHVAFNFASGATPQLTTLLDSFRTLKNQFNGKLANKTLKPHPLLSSSEGSAYFRALENQIIVKHVSKRFASGATFMGLGIDPETKEDAPHDWRFFSGQIDTQGHWNLTNLPNGSPSTFQQLTITTPEDGESGSGFVTNTPPIKGQAQVLSGDAAKFAESSLTIFDMRKTNDHNVDCASCHFADSNIFSPSLDKDSKLAFTRSLTSIFSGRKRMTELVINKDLQAGMKPSEFPVPRLFGYLDQNALVGERLVLDMATSVEQANQLFGLKETPQCPTESQRKKFVDCLYFGTYSATVSQCLKDACY